MDSFGPSQTEQQLRIPYPRQYGSTIPEPSWISHTNRNTPTSRLSGAEGGFFQARTKRCSFERAKRGPTEMEQQILFIPTSFLKHLAKVTALAPVITDLVELICWDRDDLDNLPSTTTRITHWRTTQKPRLLFFHNRGQHPNHAQLPCTIYKVKKEQLIQRVLPV